MNYPFKIVYKNTQSIPIFKVLLNEMKAFLHILFLLITFQSFSQKKQFISCDTISKDSLISFSKNYIGIKYKYASINPKKGFDCSGFVNFVFTHFKVKAPRSSIDYGAIGITIHPDSFIVGDVIVFTGTNSKNRKPGHVGIIISNYNEKLQFIHSSSNKKNGGVKISSYLDSPYYEKRFLKIVRIVKVS